MLASMTHETTSAIATAAAHTVQPEQQSESSREADGRFNTAAELTSNYST
jgi:hypothetical protein